MSNQLRSLTFLLLLLVPAAVVNGQTGTGAIQGTVNDSSGAVVPGASVQAIHTATQREYKTTSNAVGFYLFPAVQIGAYRLTVQNAGMETWQAALNLMVGQTAEVNPTLKIGSTTTVVTVAGDVTPLVTTTSPTLATIVERQRIDQLPMNGRSVATLVLMTTPGVESQGFVPRIFGLRFASELLQDGAILQNREEQALPDRLPGLDTVSEVRAETSNSSAKMNRPGTFILTTRAGTNQVHGSVFNTARNSGFGVARARTDYYDKPPHLVRNEYGASLGGPVYIPKLYSGRNRTFFFFAFEGYKLRQSATRSTAVPSSAMRSGDFSGLVNATGQSFTIYDPLTTNSGNWSRQPFPNNQVALSRMSPLAKYLYSVTPLPTRSDNPLVSANWFGIGVTTTDQHTETVRIDHRLSEKDNLFFRYSHNPSSMFRTSDPWGGSPVTLDGKANANIRAGVNDGGVASWTRTFSPTLFSETLVNVARDYVGFLPSTGTEEISTTLGLPNPFNGIGFPRIPYSMSSSTGAGMAYDSSINPRTQEASVVSIDQNFTKVHGRHELQFGLRLRFEFLNSLEDQQENQGYVNFAAATNTGLYDPGSGSTYSAFARTGHTAANVFLGLGTYSARFNRSLFKLRAGEKSGYFQDNFRLNSRLMLNLGLRYEYNSPPVTRDNTMIGFNYARKEVLLPRPVDELARMGVVLPAVVDVYEKMGVKYSTPAAAGLPSSLVYTNKWDFNPRAGFAYRIGSLSRPIVLRGGYSLFSFSERLRNFLSIFANTMPSVGSLSNNPNDATESPDGLPNYLLRSVPATIAGLNSSNALTVGNIKAITRGSGAMFFPDPDQPTSRAHQWSFMVEREVLRETVLKTGFSGSFGSSLGQFAELNGSTPAYIWYATTGQPLPTGAYANVATRPYDQEVFGSVQRYQKTGYSSNTSFQVELEHRYSKGYAFQLFYVMSNAMRMAGNFSSQDVLPDVNSFLPGMVPQDPADRSRLLFKRRDTEIPKHRVNWNFLVDLPFGKGKPIAGNAGRALQAAIGGWQVAGFGTLNSVYFQLPTSYWGPYNGVQTYGKQYPVEDCRSGVCYPAYLYWNGYIPANRINSHDAAGRPNGVMGVPDSYRPFQTPLIPIPKDGGSPSDPMFQFYDTNTVWVPMKNGTPQRVAYSPGMHFLQNQFVLGPMLWNMSASLFKTISITEQVQLRINADFLNNVFNMPGTPSPGSDGLIQMRNSANSPRVLQLTLRLSW